MIQGLSRLVLCQLLHIVYQIALHSIENLETVSFLHCMVGVRKGLDTAVIRHCDGVHAPFFCPLDNILHFGNAVHIAHLCMAVKLHTLYRTVVHALSREILALLDSHNRS